MAETYNEVIRVGVWFLSWTCFYWMTRPRIGRVN